MQVACLGQTFLRDRRNTWPSSSLHYYNYEIKGGHSLVPCFSKRTEFQIPVYCKYAVGFIAVKAPQVLRVCCSYLKPVSRRWIMSYIYAVTCHSKQRVLRARAILPAFPRSVKCGCVTFSFASGISPSSFLCQVRAVLTYCSSWVIYSRHHQSQGFIPEVLINSSMTRVSYLIILNRLTRYCAKSYDNSQHPFSSTFHCKVFLHAFPWILNKKIIVYF